MLLHNQDQDGRYQLTQDLGMSLESGVHQELQYSNTDLVWVEQNYSSM